MTEGAQRWGSLFAGDVLVRGRKAVLGDFWATFGRWQVWYVLANQDIHMRYRRSLLGPFWISFSLAAIILGLGLLYSQLFHQPFADYLTFLAPGFLCWFFLQALVMEGCNAIVENEGNMRSVPIPISVTAARVTFRNLIIFVHNAIVVVALLALFGHRLTPVAVLALGGVALYVLLGYFISIMLGPICARFRDIPQVLSSLMQMAFFLTPVMWRPVQLPAAAQVFVDGNPLLHLIELVRSPLMGNAPTETNWIVSFACLGTAFVLAVLSVGVSRKRVNLWL
jgi:lipopolysaccharide transport system permease protein